MPKKELSNKQKQEAEALGGYDPMDHLGIDPRFANRHYSEKGGHWERSLVNDPKHAGAVNRIEQKPIR